MIRLFYIFRCLIIYLYIISFWTPKRPGHCFCFNVHTIYHTDVGDTFIVDDLMLIGVCVAMLRFVTKLTTISTLYIISLTTILVCVSGFIAVPATRLAAATLRLVRVISPYRVISIGIVHMDSSPLLPFCFFTAFTLVRFTLWLSLVSKLSLVTMGTTLTR